MSASRFDRVREMPLYDQVPVGPGWRDTELPPLPPPPLLHVTVPAVSLDPFPPPPLPEQPAVGPESFYPSSDEEPAEGDCEAMDIKPVRRFIPDSVKNLFNSGSRSSKGWPVTSSTQPHSPAPSANKNTTCHTTTGVPCSPPNSAPPSPSLPGSYRDPYGVCLKLWRHEAARMRKEVLAQEMKTTGSSIPLSVLDSASRASETTPLPTIQPDIMNAPNNTGSAPLMAAEPEILRGHIPSGYIPKPVIIADYVAKYPSILSDEERDQYKAVFNDQYAEYRELHAEVQIMAKKFEEMNEMMQNLPSRPSSQMEKERISSILSEYERKKADPTYLEKRERCEYLKSKLSHIKQKIQEYNNTMD
ncbi:MARVEL domain-containing protein 2b isoform X2 [Xiphophorus couchianus]|uniref:MARVEL domain-containing protein 2b isoform X2 n=1 Tax=Xiphophorus couchianus TaxID=32473 RepID=UPI001016A965|nr:MARVEL domain-containing protein 2-like isoform X2 [Xiphophorus couchianus]